MKRGTRVGQAYVALTVDGDNINQQITDEFEDVNYDQLGRNAKGHIVKGFNNAKAGELAKGVEKEVDSVSKQMDKAVKNIETAVKNSDAISTGIRRQLDDALKKGDLDGTMRAVGRKIGVRVGDGFDDEIGAAVVNSLRDAMEEMARNKDKDFDLTATLRDTTIAMPSDTFERMAADARRNVDEMRTQLDRQNTEIAKSYRANADLADRFAEERVRLQQRSNAAILKSDDDLVRQQQVLMDRLTRENERSITERISAMQREQQTYLNDETKRQASVQRMLETANKNRQKFAEQNAATEERMADLGAKEYERAWNEAYKEQHRRESELWKVRNASAKAHAAYLAQLNRGTIDERGNTISRLGNGRDDVDMSRTIGRMFGAGSRNNGLNLIGKSLGGIIGLFSKVTKGASKMASTFMEGFNELGQGAKFGEKVMSGFSKVGAEGGGAMSKLAASGPAAAAAIAIVIVAMSVLVSIVGALLAILTALVSTIASALVGASLVGVAALGALGAAAGLAVLAFTSLTDAQSKMLKDAFTPIKESFTGLGQIIATGMMSASNNFSTWSTNIQAALTPLIPLAQRMGTAFGQAGNILTASFSGPGFKNLSASLATWLPGIVTKLSSALGGFLNGLAGMLAAIMPMVDRFAGYLNNVATRFSTWANSAKGQNSIVDFVNRAVESLKSLLNFTREFFGAIFDLLFNPQVQATGNSIFDSMARSFANLRETIANAAANGDLQQWMDDGIRFGSALWDVIKGLGDVFEALYDSGVIDGVSDAMEWFAKLLEYTAEIIDPFIKGIGSTFDTLDTLVSKLDGASGAVEGLADKLGWLVNHMPNLLTLGKGLGAINGMVSGDDSVIDKLGGSSGGGTGSGGGSGQSRSFNFDFKFPDIRDIGHSALSATSKDNGGYKSTQWVNPYTAYAESLMSSSPSIVKQIKDTMKKIASDIGTAMKEATKAEGFKAANDAMHNLAISVKDQGKALLDAARQDIDSAAQALSSASSQAAADKALARVRKAQAAYTKAQTAWKRIYATSKLIQKQGKLTMTNVYALVAGEAVRNATLADYASARLRISDKIEAANQKLADAVVLRDDYKKSITDATKAFGDITTAQAQIINGVEQKLTANDITTNLQQRLDKIKRFQWDLQLLLASGLSKSAYKQLVDAGVEQGGAYASALLAGGVGSIQQANSLVSQIDSRSAALGTQAAEQMYQAGVNAAKGLVAGLESQAKQLDAAATRLGNSIANAVKKSLGIHSPSRVLIGMMDQVGDGAVIGLDNQSSKVSAAAGRFSDNIAVSPEVASWAAQQGGSATVSGNGDGSKFRDLIVHTPTEDPVAVAHEVLNEVTGRLL